MHPLADAPRYHWFPHSRSPHQRIHEVLGPDSEKQFEYGFEGRIDLPEQAFAKIKDDIIGDDAPDSRLERCRSPPNV